MEIFYADNKEKKKRFICGIRWLIWYYSPINGNSFVWEVEGVDNLIFESYLKYFSLYKPGEFKIVVIDNAGFHSTKNIEIPENIYLLNIPPYCPELNPCEQVWQHIKNRYKNHNFVRNMTKEKIMSITGNHHYYFSFNTSLESQIGINLLTEPY